MKFKIECSRPQDTEEPVVLYLEHGTGGSVTLCAKKGHMRSGIAVIRSDGSMRLPRFVNPNLGFELDAAERMKVKEE